MAETPKTNPDPKEAIEAKLCAYLEDDLAPAERGEIDKYLAANAGHRQLLTELKKTHGLLSSLPRESAPPEIAEAFHQHLERSMLLDETVHQQAVKTNRWPQRMAIAAIVFLTFCLGGLVVYIVLPGGRLATKNNIAQNATVLPTPKPTQTNPSVPVNPTALAGAFNPQTTVDDLQKKPVAQNNDALADTNKLTTAIAAPKVVAPGATPATDDRTIELAIKSTNTQHFSLPVQVVLAARPLDEQMLAPARQLAAANDLPADNTVYMVVSTDNPSASANQVKHFFAANSFAYKTMTGDGVVEQMGESNNNAATDNSQLLQPQATSARQQSVQAQSTATILKDMNQSQSQTDSTFVARALPRPLAVALNTELSTQRSGQTSGVYYLPNDDAASKFGVAAATSLNPTTAPTDLNFAAGGGLAGGVAEAAKAEPTTEPAQTIATDQPLTVTIDQLVGPGVDKTSNVRVAADGTITLPMIEPVTAAGKTTTDLQHEIADKYRQANLIPDATVTVALSSPTTQPVASGLPTTQPTTMPSQLSNGPTTQPSESDTVNVVVLLQPAATPIAIPPATTQPVAQPATQPATTEPAVQ
jgi:Polysaccharide biosynthesis/export protein